MKQTLHFDLRHLGDMLVHMDAQTQEYTMVIVDRKTGSARAQVYDTPSFYKVLDAIISACEVMHREMDEQKRLREESVINFR